MTAIEFSMNKVDYLWQTDTGSQQVRCIMSRRAAKNRIGITYDGDVIDGRLVIKQKTTARDMVTLDSHV